MVGMAGMPGPDGQVLSGGASVYIKWGSSDCPESASLVYSGRAVSPRYNNAGGGAQYLCLPPSGTEIPTNGAVALSTLVGVHFETDGPATPPFPEGIPGIEPLSEYDKKAVVCAVCLSDNSAAIMIPNKVTCPQNPPNVNWNLEYSGFLMTARDFIFLSNSDVQQEPVFGDDAHFRTEYVCVCQNPSMEASLPEGEPYEAELAHTRIHCNRSPGLRNGCTPWFDANSQLCTSEDQTCTLGPLGCAVCTGYTV